jgi:hypothetical protein
MVPEVGEYLRVSEQVSDVRLGQSLCGVLILFCCRLHTGLLYLDGGLDTAVVGHAGVVALRNQGVLDL